MEHLETTVSCLFRNKEDDDDDFVGPAALANSKFSFDWLILDRLLCHSQSQSLNYRREKTQAKWRLHLYAVETK